MGVSGVSEPVRRNLSASTLRAGHFWSGLPRISWMPRDPGGCSPEILVTSGAAERRVPTRLVRPTMEIGQLFSLAGRRVLITGGTAGIGLGVAEHFAAAEAHVVITGRRADGDRVAESIGARFVRMDLTEPVSITGGLEE